MEYAPLCLEYSRASAIQRRILEKIDDYAEYNFSSLQSTALNVFFDLAQEFDSFRDLMTVCTLVPKVFFDLECTLYLFLEEKVEHFRVCYDSRQPKPAADIPFFISPTAHGGHYYLPIHGNIELQNYLPLKLDGNLIGILDIFPEQSLNEHDRLFFEKYANRIGFQLHSKMISQKNQEHLHFIRSLVKDIGHNVVVPNMYFKLFYRRLEGTINALGELSRDFSAMSSHQDAASLHAAHGRLLDNRLTYIHDALQDQFREILRHYDNTSLFLETLLRRSHFEQGRYVLEKRTCNFKSQIIDPQTERFKSEFEARGIEIAWAGIPDKEIEVVVDVGLINQVYANLFSNAVKYTAPVRDICGREVKFISYGWQDMPNFFGQGRDGIKLNVFSTGPHISEDERNMLFEEGFRAGNVDDEPGTGHGLFFIRQIIELHGGRMGYEPTPMGNNFYFILPRDPSDGSPSAPL
ncbi:GAF domain-containing sensor histidine kinase [Desulfonatronum thiosulfatophilum]|uniref:GAF domain-containing sensor histidine kinase n=1 Tax=Desulfonatronum thiosulfatophilum TaxID=617002 RepID=UPI001FC94EEC|nr:GAF domain-containing sensor histidine kinase [Desulfonatronum thiosulfatophilum]